MSVELKSYKGEDGAPKNGLDNPGYHQSQESGLGNGIADPNGINAYMVSNKKNETTAVNVGDPDEVTFEPLDVAENGFTRTIKTIQDAVYGAWDVCGDYVIWTILALLLIFYLVYFGLAMDYEFGPEPSVRLLWYTVVAMIIIACYVVHRIWGEKIEELMEGFGCDFEYSWVISWVVLLCIYIGVIVFIIVDMVHLTKDYYNLVSLGGMFVYVLLFYVTSHSPAHVNWRAVLWGLGMQFMFAIIILRWDVGFDIFKWIGDRISNFLSHSNAGAAFLFGEGYQEHFFAFSVLPVIIYFSTIISVLYYLGVMQLVVRCIGWGLQTLMGTTAGESLNAAGNIFIGQSEAPLMIRPLIGIMTRSELHAVMTGGFATIAGSVLAAYILFGVPANHLISASVMSAPAALAISKLRYPETQVSKTTADDVKSMEPSPERNIIEAASSGASASVKLVANIAVNLIAFISILSFLNDTLTWFGKRVGFEDLPHVNGESLTFQFICSYVLYPFAFIMGVVPEDCRKVAELIGVKTFLNEFVAYSDLGVLLENKEALSNYTTAWGDNGTYFEERGGIVLSEVSYDNVTYFNQTFLDGGILHETRSEVISTYALCGFSNIGSMGIMLGALGAMAPHRKKDLSAIVFSAMLTGNVACFMTACIAGLFYTGDDL